MSALPLAGITIVSIEQALAAPYATRQLADLGARVIKIERPGEGDFARGYDDRVNGLASYFAWANRSKESLTLDLKAPGAVSIVEALIAKADVFVQNLAPGASQRLGLSAEILRARQPGLIVCDVSGYGSSGPYVDKKAYDLLVQSEVGLMSVTGTHDEAVRAGISVADIASGMYAYAGILTALFNRERTGEGASIEVSLFDALAEWMGHPMYYALYSGLPPERSGSSHPSIVPYGSFKTLDGEVQFGIQNEREWVRFCDFVLRRPQVSGDSRFATNAARVGNREVVTSLIDEVLGDLSTVDVIARLDGAQIANARRSQIADLIAHPQLAERDRWRDVDSPVGLIKALRPPAIIKGMAERFDPIPAVGEHTDAILAELGYDDAHIADLRDAGAV